MKTVYLFTIFSLLTISASKANSSDEASPNDTEIGQKIIGVWIVDIRSTNSLSIEGTVAINSDESFISKATITRAGHSQSVRYEGTWQVKDGFLIETITKSDFKSITVGKITHDKIVGIDENEMVFQTESGKTETRKRIE